MSGTPDNSDNAAPPRDDARARQLEGQLDELRAQLLHLTHERERWVYSATGHLYRPLRAVEAKIVALLQRLRGR
jgi:hypothetical protein